jgi:hypothetical protein
MPRPAAYSTAPTLAAYLAYETLAGAFLHLIVLGLGMGVLLGVAGGALGAWRNVRGRGRAPAHPSARLLHLSPGPAPPTEWTTRAGTRSAGPTAP